MKTKQKDIRYLSLAITVLLISILLMIVITPEVFSNSLPGKYNQGAIIGISLAIIIRLIILIWMYSVQSSIKKNGKKKKEALIIIGILLLFFGILYTDGALAFLDNKNIPFVSYFMFSSVLCDTIASIITLKVAFYSNNS